MHRQRGVATVEFALIAIVLFMLMFGAAEVGRTLWVWNAASEATRLGARLAVVCDMDEARVKLRMRERLGELADANITLAYEPAGCNANNCTSVSVSLTGRTATTFIPGVSFAPRLPAFTTTLSREYMSSAANPVCQ